MILRFYSLVENCYCFCDFYSVYFCRNARCYHDEVYKKNKLYENEMHYVNALNIFTLSNVHCEP